MLTAYALSIGLNICPQGHLDQSMIQDLGPSSELCNKILELSLMSQTHSWVFISIMICSIFSSPGLTLTLGWAEILPALFFQGPTATAAYSTAPERA